MENKLMLWLCDQCRFQSEESFGQCPSCSGDEVFSTPEWGDSQIDEFVIDCAFDFKQHLFDVCNPKGAH